MEENLQEETIPFDGRKLWFLQEVFREYAVLFGDIADSHDFLIGKSLKHITHFTSKNMQIDIKQGLKVLKKQVKQENKEERKEIRKLRRYNRHARFKAFFKKIFTAHSKCASETACCEHNSYELAQEDNNE